jgi:hypothetical protein
MILNLNGKYSSGVINKVPDSKKARARVPFVFVSY